MANLPVCQCRLANRALNFRRRSNSPPKRETLRHAAGARVCDPQLRGQAEGRHEPIVVLYSASVAVHGAAPKAVSRCTQPVIPIDRVIPFLALPLKSLHFPGKKCAPATTAKTAIMAISPSTKIFKPYAAVPKISRRWRIHHPDRHSSKT